MRIGVLSDTHLSSPDPQLDWIVEDILAGSDIILHAGDIVSIRVLEHLQEKGVIAVCGNMDDYDIMEAVPQTRLIQAGGKRIGLIHGWGSKVGLEERILACLEPEKPDIIVYGHSHRPFWGKVHGVGMFNPGSALRGSYSDHGTVGVIDIQEGGIEAKILPVGA